MALIADIQKLEPGGEIRLFGTERGRFTDWRRIGYVPQGREIFPRLHGENHAFSALMLVGVHAKRATNTADLCNIYIKQMTL